MTQIHEPGFSLNLPGEWGQAQTDQPGTLVYLETDGIGSVTVVLLAVRPMFAIADRSRLLGDYMQHRAEFEKGQMPSLEQSDPVAWDQDGAIEGSWSAIDLESGIRQIHRVVMAGDILADFCYEATDLDVAEFAIRAAGVLDSAVVGDEPPEGSDQADS